MTAPVYEVSVSGEGLTPEHERGLERAARQALLAAGAPGPCALGVTVTTAEHVRQLNRDYAGLDETTDVLSFGAEDEPYETEPGEPPYLGDVVIARSVAEQQAVAAGHSPLVEMQLLTVHGVLHLLGYDHQDAAQQAEMQALEAAALGALSSRES